MYSQRRTSKIQELIEMYNSTDYYVAEHFTSISPLMMMKHLLKHNKKIEDIIVIRKR